MHFSQVLYLSWPLKYTRTLTFENVCQEHAQLADEAGPESVFEGYYKQLGLLESEDEWHEFMASLRRPLPVTFRVNRGLHSEELVEQCLSRAHHILEPADRDLPFERGARVGRPQRLEWCDGVQLGVDRMVLKTGRSQYVKDLRQWLMLWGTLPSHTGATTSAGVITRQEAQILEKSVTWCV